MGKAHLESSYEMTKAIGFGEFEVEDKQDPLRAEIIALKMGIQALIIRGGNIIIIETDSSTTVHLIQEVVDEDHPRAELINDCQKMLANVFILWL